MKLVNKIAGKKSKWKIVEKEFVQGKDVSQNDAWKLILLSDFFPKVPYHFSIADLIIKQNSGHHDLCGYCSWSEWFVLWGWWRRREWGRWWTWRVWRGRRSKVTVLLENCIYFQIKLSHLGVSCWVSCFPSDPQLSGESGVSLTLSQVFPGQDFLLLTIEL